MLGIRGYASVLLRSSSGSSPAQVVQIFIWLGIFFFENELKRTEMFAFWNENTLLISVDTAFKYIKRKLFLSIS